MNIWEKKRRIMRRYDATADIYDMRYAEEQAAKYGVALENTQKERLGLVLDVGCGTGLLFSHVADRAEAIVGLDISKKTLLKARDRVRFVWDVHLVCADVDFLPFVEKVFDNVFAMTLIQNTPDPSRTLGEIRRVSRCGATVVVTGLKKVFSKEAFRKLLHNADLGTTVLKDGSNLRCYVAISVKTRH
jgi:malonyl-CoA O-methyltransferase